MIFLIRNSHFDLYYLYSNTIETKELLLEQLGFNSKKMINEQKIQKICAYAIQNNWEEFKKELGEVGKDIYRIWDLIRVDIESIYLKIMVSAQ